MRLSNAYKIGCVAFWGGKRVKKGGRLAFGGGKEAQAPTIDQDEMRGLWANLKGGQEGMLGPRGDDMGCTNEQSQPGAHTQWHTHSHTNTVFMCACAAEAKMARIKVWA